MYNGARIGHKWTGSVHGLLWRVGHPSAYLPGGKAGGAHQVTAGLNLHVLVVLRTDLTQLEGGAHLAVQLVLLLLGEKGALTHTVKKPALPVYGACLNSPFCDLLQFDLIRFW